MDNKQHLTMKDIAQELGVSVATVSRALSDSPSISRARRQAIQQYAREHNYFPNVIAEQLRHNRRNPSRAIGVIVPELVHYYFSSVLDGIESEASSRGYHLIVAKDPSSAGAQRCGRAPYDGTKAHGQPRPPRHAERAG